MHVRGSRWVQAPDCGAPAGPSDFAAGLIRLSLFCDEHDVPYVVIDTGQSVILKA